MARGNVFLKIYTAGRGRREKLELFPNGILRLESQSEDGRVAKEVRVAPEMIDEVCDLVEREQVFELDHQRWPEPGRVSTQELEVVVGPRRVFLATTEVGHAVEARTSADPDGLLRFFYLVRDIREILLLFVKVHHHVNPI